MTGKFTIAYLISFLALLSKLAAGAPFQQPQKSILLTESSAFPPSSFTRTVPRGGATSRRSGSKRNGRNSRNNNDDFSMTKSTVVKFHGYITLAIAAMAAAELLGVNVPLGFAETFARGWNFGNDALMATVRLTISFLVFAGLIEIQLSNNKTVQTIFSQYHILHTILLFISAEAHDTTGSYLYTGIAAAFLLASVVAK